MEINQELYDKERENLEKYSEDGVILRISGKRSYPSNVVKECCIRERGSYMGDYILDDNGNLKEIRFQKIRNECKKEYRKDYKRDYRKR